MSTHFTSGAEKSVVAGFTSGGISCPVIVINDFAPKGLVDTLWRELPFEKRADAPRFELWMNDFGRDYTYGRGTGERTYKGQDWFPLAADLRKKALDVTRHDLNCCFVNGYENERQHLGWHADDSLEMDPERPIVVVSFGAEREIWFRPIGQTGERTHAVSLPDGSALIMPAGMQQVWHHRIPKHPAPCGPRISFTYRGLI